MFWMNNKAIIEIGFRMIAELWRAKRACGAPWVSKSTHPRKFGNHVTVHRPPAARPSAPQGNQYSIPHFLTSLGAQEDWYCTHIAHQGCDQLTAVKTRLTSITWPRAQVSTHWGRVFFEVIRWQVTSFQMIAGSSLIFQFMWNLLCFICAAQLKFWFQTDLES